jgi:hypothetical protein
MKYYLLKIQCLLLLLPLLGSAQQSEKVHLYDTCLITSVNDYNRLVKYFLMEGTDVKYLYKVDVMQLANLKVNFGFEHKVSQHSSLQYTLLYTYLDDTYGLFSQNPRLHHSAFYIDYKYFHNLKSREKMRKNTKRFSGNYFCIGINSYINYYSNPVQNTYSNKLVGDYSLCQLGYGDILDKVGLNDFAYIPQESAVFISGGYGLQRSIGKIGFVGAELKMGIGTDFDFSKTYFLPEINIKAGFAISSLKTLKQ